MVIPVAILKAIAAAADTHPATVRAAYAGANVRPCARRRIFDAVRALGGGRWPFPPAGNASHRAARKPRPALPALAPSLAVRGRYVANARGISHAAPDQTSADASEVRS